MRVKYSVSGPQYTIQIYKRGTKYLPGNGRQLEERTGFAKNIRKRTRVQTGKFMSKSV
jgi:hypothetical protein